MPVFPVMSRLCPSEIFRLRSLIKGLSEEGAEMQSRSRRKAVSAGSAAGHPGALGLEQGAGHRGRHRVSIAKGKLFSWGHITSGLGLLGGTVPSNSYAEVLAL